MEAANHLMAREVKVLVIACNTATAAALPFLRQSFPIPVVGVIEPGAQAAVSATRGRVGVIATEGTIRSGAYREAIHRIHPGIEVTEAACPLFVPLAEEGWANTHVALEVAEVYLKPLVDCGIDTLVLGCTHYPILRATIESVVGEDVRIVDSAETTARCAADILARLDLLADPSSIPSRHYLVTDATERFRRIAGQFLEEEIESLELVSL
jgi:glutamate racemase